MCRVIKLGGNALSTPLKQKEALKLFEKQKDKLVVVVSAIGRLGFPYATDTLLKLIDPEKITPKEKARLLSCGEIVASIVLSNLLNQNNLKAISISPLKIGFLSDSNYLKSYVHEIDNGQWINLLDDYDIIVIPGFVACNDQGEVTLLGRGGSDLSAIFIGEVCKIDQVTLYKDVDGVYVTQGGLMKQEPIPNLSYDEMIAMENIGFEIVNLDAIKEAKNAGITIYVKNVNGCEKMTEISSKESKRNMLGINVVDNALLLASLNPKDLIRKVEELLNHHHIYFKENEIMKNYVRIKVNLSQLYLAKKLILEYF